MGAILILGKLVSFNCLPLWRSDYQVNREMINGIELGSVTNTLRGHFKVAVVGKFKITSE